VEVVVLVDECSDAANGAAVTARHEVAHGGVAVEGVAMHRVKELLAFRKERWHPVRVVFVDLPLKMDELRSLFGRLYRRDG
jgi:hypothetical protein